MTLKTYTVTINQVTYSRGEVNITANDEDEAKEIAEQAFIEDPILLKTYDAETLFDVQQKRKK